MCNLVYPDSDIQYGDARIDFAASFTEEYGEEIPPGYEDQDEYDAFLADVLAWTWLEGTQLLTEVKHNEYTGPEPDVLFVGTNCNLPEEPEISGMLIFEPVDGSAGACFAEASWAMEHFLEDGSDACVSNMEGDGENEPMCIGY